jgi:hypothetical protein
MNKRYQVFVSSTYLDLKEERAAVMRTLLEMKHFPAGMELFPAAYSKPKEVIKEVINDCDYYVVIVGGRYGSETDDGCSYTRWEYQYARQRGIPILTFLRQDSDYIPDGCEAESAESKRKLLEFRKELEGLQYKMWTTPDGLGKDLVIALNDQIKKTPAVGWVRADHFAGNATSNREIDQIREELRVLSQEPPPAIAHLQQGDDQLEVSYRYWGTRHHQGRVTHHLDRNSKLTCTWNDIVRSVCPRLMAPATEREMQKGLEDLIRKRVRDSLRQKHKVIIDGFQVDPLDFQQIKTHLRALKIIQEAELPDPSGGNVLWKLTAFGDACMTDVLTLRREEGSESAGIEAASERVSFPYIYLLGFADEYGGPQGSESRSGTTILALNSIFSQLGPVLMSPKDEADLVSSLRDLVEEKARVGAETSKPEDAYLLSSPQVKQESLYPALMKLRDLGWIVLDKSASDRPGGAVWKLSKQGTDILRQLSSR